MAQLWPAAHEGRLAEPSAFSATVKVKLKVLDVTRRCAPRAGALVRAKGHNVLRQGVVRRWPHEGVSFDGNESL